MKKKIPQNYQFARLRYYCERRDNHKSELLTSCFRPISWQPQKRDNAEIAILMCAFMASNSYPQLTKLGEPSRSISGIHALAKKVHWACEKTTPFVTQNQ